MKITGIITAGGKSRRLGEDKAFVRVGGVPVVERVIKVVEPLCAELLISSNDADSFGKYGFEVAPDEFQNIGVLAGIHASLKRAHNHFALVVACDMPFINGELLELMIGKTANCDALVPRWKSEWEPLHAIYSKACVPPIEEIIQSSRRRIVDFYNKINLAILEEDEIKDVDPEGLSFLNINTPEQLQRALQIAAEMAQ